MADVKWIKIVTDIFDDEKMYAIECMPDGQIIQLVWLKILCLAGKCNQNGFLVINQKIAYTDEMLAKIFRMEIGVVQRALEIFQNLEMVEIVDDSYMISNWLMYQSGDKLEEVREKNRQRQKRFRESQKVRQIEDKTNSNVTNNVTNNVTPSYSYSNNSNISNYLYIKDNSNEDYIEFIRMNTDIDDEVSLWMKYKDERKPKSNNHYEETGLNSLLKKIHKMCLQYGNKTVVNVIEDSMSNNYQGIVWDKITKQTSKAEKGGANDRVGTDVSQDEAEYERQVREQLKRIESGEFDNENLWE